MQRNYWKHCKKNIIWKMSEEENTEDQSTDSGPQSTEDQNISEPSTCLPDSQAINHQPSINMEVHHHPKVEKKNFKEYFLEFLMIFNKNIQI